MKTRITTTLTILFLSVAAAFAQNRTFKGTVIDNSDGQPVIGASIIVKDGKGKILTGVASDINGDFSVELPTSAMEIVVTNIGYVEYKAPARPSAAAKIYLDPDSAQLDAVVVTALGISREAKSLNYARQSVDTEMMNEIKAGDFVASLSGKVAGVAVTPAGVTNGTSRIVIRGTSSLTENSMPVFVIDGMVIENQPGDTNFGIDGGSGTLDMGNPAADINPDDVESVEILKGPNAAALYGSRAANGVVLITTKKAQSQNRVRVSYNGNFQFEKINQFLEYQNGWGTGENNFKLENSTYTLPQDSGRTNATVPDLTGYNDKAGAKLRSWGAPLWDQPIIGHDGLPTTHSAHPENVKDFYSTAHKYSNSFTIDGGSRENNFRVSYTNVLTNSVVHGINESNKNVFNARLFNTMFKFLTLDSKLTYTREAVKNRQYMNGSDRNPIYAFVTLPRDITVETMKHYKDEYGNEMIPIGERGYNPYWNIYENTNGDVRDRVTGSAVLEAKIIPGLVVQAKAGVDYYGWTGTEFSNMGARSDLDGSMENWSTRYLSDEFSGHVRYEHNFADVFSFSALVGGSTYYRFSEKQTQEITSLLVAGFQNISNSGEYPVVSQTKSEKRIHSVYGSASLGLYNWLFVDFTARNDWSSTLPVQNCSYFYPSIGGSFVFSDAFKINKSIVSFGKIRASYAYAGADTSPYRTGQTFAYSALYNGQPLQSISTTLNNPELKPEQTRSLEVGAEVSFLNNRLGVDLTYYNSKSYDLITSVTLSSSSGYSKRYLNAGQINNQGFELVFNANPVSVRNFKWNFTVNYAMNRSKVVKVSDESPTVSILKSSNVTINLEEGRPYGVLRGRDVMRDEYGRMIVNADGQPLVTDNMQELGIVEPKWTGSFINSFNIFGVSVNFQIDARIGGVLYSGTWNRATTAGVVAATYAGREEYYLSSVILGESAKKASFGFQWEDAVFEDGSKCEMFVNPRYQFGSWDSRNVFDASYIKLREVSVGYSIPKKYLTKLPLSDVRVSLVGRNLAILYQKTPKGIDPEAAVSSGNAQGIEYGGMPPVSTVGFDVKLSF
ncbi:MAG: SusC/RagA family TonB-linked outer membrane protein [Bacteroidales bacterium]|nr:SusC/RagA family TonB-linked outer membrane protein [Bacteroidales bacterium]